MRKKQPRRLIGDHRLIALEDCNRRYHDQGEQIGPIRIATRHGAYTVIDLIMPFSEWHQHKITRGLSTTSEERDFMKQLDPSQIGKTPLTLWIDGSAINGALLRRFLASGGRELVIDLLSRAGYSSGRWRVKAVKQLNVCNEPPNVQVVRPDVHAVILKVKPAKDASLWCRLDVERDKGTPDEVYKRLLAANQALATATAGTNDEDHDDADGGADPLAQVIMNEGDETLFLLAIGGLEEQGGKFSSHDEFLRAALAELGANPPAPERYRNTVVNLVQKGLIRHFVNGLQLTDLGRMRIGQKPASTWDHPPGDIKQQVKDLADQHIAEATGAPAPRPLPSAQSANGKHQNTEAHRAKAALGGFGGLADALDNIRALEAVRAKKAATEERNAAAVTKAKDRVLATEERYRETVHKSIADRQALLDEEKALMAKMDTTALQALIQQMEAAKAGA